MASAAIYVLNLHSEVYRSNTSPMLSHINVGSGNEVSISDLAVLISDIVGYSGKIKFDSSKPDGAPRKLMDVSRLSAMGWRSKIELREGLLESYNWFVDNNDNFRR
jgi:nucleoside-diphosphate-sugar epimerase